MWVPSLYDNYLKYSSVVIYGMTLYWDGKGVEFNGLASEISMV